MHRMVPAPRPPPRSDHRSPSHWAILEAFVLPTSEKSPAITRRPSPTLIAVTAPFGPSRGNLKLALAVATGNTAATIQAATKRQSIEIAGHYIENRISPYQSGRIQPGRSRVGLGATSCSSVSA